MLQRNIYLDLDGVMADFEAYYLAFFGHKHDSISDSDMWKNINGHGSFFRNLPPCPGALEFFESIKHLNPVILTACPKSNYNVTAVQKREWVRQHLSDTCWILPVLGGKNKALFMQSLNDILIDDFEDNITSWNKSGGIGILHTNFDMTRIELRHALDSFKPK